MAAASNAKLNQSTKSTNSKNSNLKSKRKSRKSRKSKSKPKSPVPKLQYMELPNDFKDIDPAFWENLLLFWSPIFKRTELMELKERLHAMIAEDTKIKLKNHGLPLNTNGLHRVWSVCEIVKKIFPGYFVPMINEQIDAKYGRIREREEDFSAYQIICCSTMMLYGIIASRLLTHDQDYQLLFKGGKAIQMGLQTEYESEDIDVIIDPIYAYDRVMVDNISGHLALLIRWLLPFYTTVLPPGKNPDVYKVSFIKSDRSFKAFSDIDLKQIDPLDPYLKEYDASEHHIDALQEDARFKRPVLEKILEEKIFYYRKYKKLLADIKPGVNAKAEEDTCDPFMKKFKRAIHAIAPDIEVDQL
jgi:hypothetical protein